MNPEHSVFKIARESITAEQAAIKYGVEVNRRRRAKCPFHNGDHYNLSFKNGGFNCFVCGEKGDSIRFTGLIFGYAKPIDALKQLNNDFHLGLDLDGAKHPDHAEMNTIRRKAAERDLSRRVENILWEYALNMEWVKGEYAPKTPEESIPGLWVHALHDADYAVYLHEWYVSQSDAGKLQFILENRKAVSEYEALNGRIDKLVRQRNTA